VATTCFTSTHINKGGISRSRQPLCYPEMNQRNSVTGQWPLYNNKYTAGQTCLQIIYLMQLLNKGTSERWKRQAEISKVSPDSVLYNKDSIVNIMSRAVQYMILTLNLCRRWWWSLGHQEHWDTENNFSILL